MARRVRDSKGRLWSVYSRIEWTDPEAEEEFEHDVGGGQVTAMILLIVLFVLLIGFIYLTPPSVRFPAWLALAFALLILFFPVRWLVRRPWTLIAQTEEPDVIADRWVGRVRGYFSARSEIARAHRHLRRYAVPDRDGDGPLRPVLP